MPGLPDIPFKSLYAGKGSKILSDFVLPALSVATEYDRVTSFYTIDSLLSIAQGLQSLYERGGRMRLIIGLHSFPQELADAHLRRAHLEQEIARIREEISSSMLSMTDALEHEQLATLAWMIEDGLLSVKAAAMAGGGIFHPKTFIFRDSAENAVVAVGSSNETTSGLGSNYEQLMVSKSWQMPEAAEELEQYFEELWSGKSEDAIVANVDEALAETILSATQAKRHAVLPNQIVKGFISTAAEMPANFFVSGAVPALFQHQERAVLDALSRWPVRVLLGDEVGLGKTFEAAAIIAHLIKYGGVKRVLVLVPKAVLKQWQDELSAYFGINAWLYDSASHAYRLSDGAIITMASGEPLAEESPAIMLMSAQFARGGAGRPDVFSSPHAVLPDLLVVDEAHAARVSKDISGKKKATRMYEMLAKICPEIPHVVLATATPMQKDPEEYHAMLALLGMPRRWKNAKEYLGSLRCIVDGNAVPSVDAAYASAALVRDAVEAMAPSRNDLEVDQKELLEQLLSMDITDRYEIANVAQTSWKTMRELLMKLHPAHFLTVRNTRRSLKKMGYVFPERKLHEVSLGKSTEIQLFYMDVNSYLSKKCFSVESALHPGEVINIGFVRTSYRQRVASSLQSCKRTLERRMEKVLSLRKSILGGAGSFGVSNVPLSDILDDAEADELLLLGYENDDDTRAISKINYDQLKWAVDTESVALESLIEKAGDLLSAFGDMKVDRSIELARSCLEGDDRVLVFSRYADTVDALIDSFCKHGLSKRYEYGVFTGQRSEIVSDNTAWNCTREQIKDELAKGTLRILFCSDAASEGLNLQAARVLINVDVPWTPSRLEQRIGRIARLGQKSAAVDIYNIWYPNSIEAQMYTRIQKRLELLNMAVGEYPDVVADEIRDALLGGEDDDNLGLASLQEFRESVQAKALEKLWSPRNRGTLSSKVVREALYNSCQGDADGFATEEGAENTISLTSAPLAKHDFRCTDLHVAHDKQGNPAAYVSERDGLWLDQDGLAARIRRETAVPMAPISRYPETLPDPSALDLSFALSAPVPPRPHYWPPTMGSTKV